MGEDVIQTRPWKISTHSAAKEIYHPKGMIGPEERRCFYWLGKNWLSGRGCIVDAGAFLGASTLCFAAGAAAGGRQEFKRGPLVHAYDYFAVMDAYVGAAITKDFRPITEGESYLDIFQLQTRAYAELIRAYPGDFLTHRWAGDPIEVLFIDIAKTSELCAHAVAQFFPSLIPGRSVVVHQDYFHCWHPYIHIGMEYLDEEFELIDECVPYQSRVWRLAKAIPPEKLARVAAYDFSTEERMALLDRLVAKSSQLSRPMIEIVRVWQKCLDGDVAGARTEIDRLRAHFAIYEHHASRWQSWFGVGGRISRFIDAVRRGRRNDLRGLAAVIARVRHWRAVEGMRALWASQTREIEAMLDSRG